MKSRFLLIVSTLLFFGNAFSNVLRIPYAGGLQTGTFKIEGDASSAGAIDTVIIDSNLIVTNFLATKSFPFCTYNPTYEYGLLIKAQSGVGGKKIADTVWQNAKTFPDSLISLDSVPIPGGYVTAKSTSDNHQGLNEYIVNTDGECSPTSTSLINAYNSVVYFQLNGSPAVYGKLQVYAFEANTGAITNLSFFFANVDVAYTLSNTKNLDSGPVGVFRLPANVRGGAAFSGKLFEPNGRRIQQNSLPNRTLQAVPLLAPTQ